MVDPSLPSVSRRSVLKASMGAAALGAGGASLLSACGGSKTSSGGSSSASSGPVTIGSNYSDTAVKTAFAGMITAYQTKSGKTVTINTQDHSTFQNNIQNYLQGTPDPVFSWFAGNRMKFFASQKLAEPIDDVWNTIGANFSDAIKNASKGDDGHYYFVPLYNYPWVMNYRKSVFKEKGYSVPKTWDELITLAKKMKSDGMTPISFTDKDGWPAMGTFDILNMRMNGYQFHVDLMNHKEAWTDSKVVAVFNQWKELFDYYTPNANGLTWEQGAQSLQNKKTGMMFIGAGQVGQQFSSANLPDLAFFPFPEIDSSHPTTEAIDAPIDGFMLSTKGKDNQAAKDLLTYIGSAAAEQAYLKGDPTDVGTATNYPTSTYNALQKASAAIISSTKNFAQFLDRDTRPDFAYPIVQNALQGFINDKDANKVTSSLETQAKSIFS